VSRGWRVSCQIDLLWSALGVSDYVEAWPRVEACGWVRTLSAWPWLGAVAELPLLKGAATPQAEEQVRVCMATPLALASWCPVEAAILAEEAAAP
jgi:hypothetical protein